MSNDFTPEIVYFDSQPLHGCHWPQLSKSLQLLLHVTRLRGITLRVPLAVDGELEKQFIDDISKQAQAVGACNQLIETIGCAPLDLPHIQELLPKYRAAVASAKRTLQIEPVPLPRRSIEDFLNDAIYRYSPFRKDSDRGFKDAVIFQSIREDLKASHAKVGVLITADSDYGGDQHPVGEDKTLLIVKDMNSLITSLEAKPVVVFPRRSSLLVAKYQGSPQFDFMDGDNYMSSRGADFAYFAAHAHTPCEPGTMIDLSGGLSGSFLGSGPAQIRDQRWNRAFYAGRLRLRGDAVDSSAQMGELKGAFTCAGEIQAYRSNPLVSYDKLFRVSVAGEGTVTVALKSLGADQPIFAGRIEYVFEKVNLTPLD